MIPAPPSIPNSGNAPYFFCSSMKFLLSLFKKIGIEAGASPSSRADRLKKGLLDPSAIYVQETRIASSRDPIEERG